MEDYPRNVIEFEAGFANEEACREYLCHMRWPDGFVCPRCKCRKSWPVREVLLQCAHCGHETSVVTGRALCLRFSHDVFGLFSLVVIRAA